MVCTLYFTYCTSFFLRIAANCSYMDFNQFGVHLFESCHQLFIYAKRTITALSFLALISFRNKPSNLRALPVGISSATHMNLAAIPSFS